MSLKGVHCAIALCCHSILRISCFCWAPPLFAEPKKESCLFFPIRPHDKNVSSFDYTMKLSTFQTTSQKPFCSMIICEVNLRYPKLNGTPQLRPQSPLPPAFRLASKCAEFILLCSLFSLNVHNAHRLLFIHLGKTMIKDQPKWHCVVL